MKAEYFFNALKSKKFKKSFVLTDIENEKLYSWFIDFESLKPIKAEWSKNGLDSVMFMSTDDYIDAWTEYRKECNGARVDTYGWELVKGKAASRLSKTENKPEKRFWMSFLEALDYQQIDSRV